MNLFTEQQWRHRLWTRVGRGERGRHKWTEEHAAYALTYVNREPVGVCSELTLGICNNQRGGNGQEVGGRFEREGIDTYG